MRPLAALTFTLVSAASLLAPALCLAYTGDEKSCIFASMERLPKVPNMVVRAAMVADYKKGDGGPGKPAGSALNDPKTVNITIGLPDLPALDTTFSFICGSSDIGGVSNTVSIPNGKPK